MLAYLLLPLMCFAHAPQPSPADSPIRETLRRFLENDFAGEETRPRTLVVFSERRRGLETRRDPLFRGRAYFLEYDPLFIVDEYKIGSVERTASGASVRVSFHVLGEATGESPATHQVRALRPAMVEVRYSLVFRGGKWYVLDPPEPYVSVRALLDFYRATINGLPDGWRDSAGYCESQRAAWARLVDEERVLSKVDENSKEGRASTGTQMPQ